MIAGLSTVSEDPSVEVSAPGGAEYLADQLLAALARLTRLYAVPDAEGLLALAAAREAAVLAQAGLAPTAYLACVLLCVAATTDGPALVLGPWGCSALVRRCAAWQSGYEPAVAGSADDADLFTSEHDEFMRMVGSGWAGPPHLLLATDLSSTLLEALRAALPEHRVAVEQTPTMGSRLRMVLLDPPVAGLDSGAAGDIALRGISAYGTLSDGVVDCSVSRLWRLLEVAKQLVELHEDVRLDLSDIPVVDAPTAESISAGWLSLLPELPPWIMPATTMPNSLTELRAQWLSTVPPQLEWPAAQAIKTWATLTWRLAYVTARFPTMAWSALLALYTGPDIAAVESALRARGIELLVTSDLEMGQFSLPGAGGLTHTSRKDASQSADPVVPSWHEGEEITLDGRVLELRRLNGGPQPLILALIDTGDTVARVLAAPTETGSMGLEDSSSVHGLKVVVAQCGAIPMLISTYLVAPPPAGPIDVRIPLVGKRDLDLDRIDQVCTLLERYPGQLPLRLYLLQGGRQRPLDLDWAVAWSPALHTALEAVVGSGNVSLSGEH